ncbi:hypothetical protein [Agrococcus sp. SGAir0287]|uniref:hypothetical protein n=1 Tax=Agrococcus sp. SGAir0287 TaxID=2070347 RepID=UPI001586115D|nr:hypothetical protein [Agrococcus sp. SGAir0287]
MRIVAVDERTSTWERADPRYRLHLFEGAGFATTTLDVVDARSIERVLDDAARLAGDARLWSLALVSTDERGTQGLVWLSGMDYHQVPRTQEEWRRRGDMQDRLLSARSRDGRPLMLPDGRRVLRMLPEWVSGVPLWESFSDEYHLRDADGLGLAPRLVTELVAWNEWWLARDVDDEVRDHEGWIAEGLRLHAALQEQLEGVAEVRREFGP